MTKREYERELARRLYGNKRPKVSKVRPIEGVWRNEEAGSKFFW